MRRYALFGSPLRTVVAAVVLAVLAALGLGPVAAPAGAATATTISVDGTSGGRTFDGIGAISGGGGNSRLLTDYPAAQQQQILDYLFKPGYGADLQIFKVEIGGDTNSTDGSESSHEHTSGAVDCTTGYEWWLMEQAKARNPGIKLYGLAWGAPGYLGGGNFWSTDTVNYLVDWLGCAKSHGLTIDYLGGWNERGYNVAWYEQLRAALDSNGYSGTRIVGADSDWSVANDVASDSAFAASVSVIGAHYPCAGGDGGSADTCPSTSTAVGTGKPLWASENGSQDRDSGAPALIRSFTRGYIDGKLTAYINWPVAAAVYPNLPYDTDGLVLANQPYSGAYSVGKNLWATAQITQFTSPGWKFVDAGSGYLGGNESNGSFVTLKSASGSDYSTVIEATTATAAQTVNVRVSGGLSTGAVHVWATNVNSATSGDNLVQQSTLTPSGGAYSLTVQPGYVYTLTTTTGQGKGTAQGPAAKPQPLPYSDGFDGDQAGQQPAYLAQQQGAFEVTGCAGGRSGNCVTQQAATKPIEWDGDSAPYTFGGGPGWADYTVAADTLIRQPGAVQLLARVGNQAGFNPANIDAYYLQVSDTGAWSILRNSSSGSRTTLASGTTTALGTGTWHHLALTVNGSTLTAAVDGNTVGSASDTSYATGMVGLGTSGYQTDQFDNLTVTPVGSTGTVTGHIVSGAGVDKCLDDNTGSSDNGTAVQIYDCNTSGAQNWTVPAPGGAGAGTVQINGKCLDATANGTANGTLVELWDCNGGGNQQWLPQIGTLYNPVSGRCLDIPKGDTTNGNQLELWDCNGGSNQQWRLPS
ncbi:ricin-type beta-trefoil lectin domain protein [Streptomyces sp. NPDC088194]|uniref:ricin-type beta-trefoil lectin domain protein n=1 Tax=Streptomyces sp. NPDC088194 TaxID=3154931 RepID=UPI00344B4124